MATTATNTFRGADWRRQTPSVKTDRFDCTATRRPPQLTISRFSGLMCVCSCLVRVRRRQILLYAVPSPRFTRRRRTSTHNSNNKRSRRFNRHGRYQLVFGSNLRACDSSAQTKLPPSDRSVSTGGLTRCVCFSFKRSSEVVRTVSRDVAQGNKIRATGGRQIDAITRRVKTARR